PEGDFTSAEVSFAIENGYTPASLGTSILRTETAGVVACTLANNL
ncbi:MAG: 16S rRNA (uracil(1498)-N(3))-methyltransferase, partial [Salibacteraceae bacterium]